MHDINTHCTVHAWWEKEKGAVVQLWELTVTMLADGGWISVWLRQSPRFPDIVSKYWVLTFHLATLLPFKKAPAIEPARKLPQQGLALPISGSKYPYTVSHPNAFSRTPMCSLLTPRSLQRLPSSTPITKKHNLPLRQTCSTFMILFMAAGEGFQAMGVDKTKHGAWNFRPNVAIITKLLNRWRLNLVRLTCHEFFFLFLF